MPFDRASCFSQGLKLKQEGSTDEELLRFMRSEGASMMESVSLMRQMKNVSLREAQDLVHLSATWQDEKESHEQLQENLFKALQLLNNETEE